MVMYPLFESVAYLHKMGIVHRDIKPGMCVMQCVQQYFEACTLTTCRKHIVW
jgi:hypothetical protein